MKWHLQAKSLVRNWEQSRSSQPNATKMPLVSHPNEGKNALDSSEEIKRVMRAKASKDPSGEAQRLLVGDGEKAVSGSYARRMLAELLSSGASADFLVSGELEKELNTILLRNCSKDDAVRVLKANGKTNALGLESNEVEMLRLFASE